MLLAIASFAGAMATDNIIDIIRDMLSAKTIRKKAKMNPLAPDWEMGVLIIFFDLIKTLKLATFTRMNKIKTCKVNSKFISMQSCKSLIAKIVLGQ